MANGASARSRMASPHALKQKRPCSVAFADTDDDGNDYTDNIPVKKQKLVSSKLRLTYPLDEIKQAMRGELLSTPALKYVLDEMVEDMADCKQDERRSLGSNKFFGPTKAALKNGQQSLVGIKRYLLAEAFIRIDNWSLINIREWFDLVAEAGLEKDFRDLYWEDNQKIHAIQIAKLARHVTKPQSSRVRELSLAQAAQFAQVGQDMVARSVFVSGRGHPIIRSAAAIMVLAEFSDAELRDKRQENNIRVTQIWAAWCISKHLDEKEMQFLAVLILDRIHKNDIVKACFIHIHEELRRCARKADEDEYKKWQRMHWKCHVINSSEILNRPKALQTFDDSRDTPSRQSDTSKIIKTKNAAGTPKNTSSSRRPSPTVKAGATSGTKTKRTTDMAVETTESTIVETEQTATNHTHPDESAQPKSQTTTLKSTKLAKAPHIQLSVQLPHPSVASSTLSSPSPLMTPASTMSPNQSMYPSSSEDPMAVVASLMQQFAHLNQGKKSGIDNELYQAAMANMRAEVAETAEPMRDRISNLEGLYKDIGNNCQNFFDRCEAIGGLEALAERQGSMAHKLESLGDKQTNLDRITIQKLATESKKIGDRDNAIQSLQSEVSFLKNRLKQLSSEMRALSNNRRGGSNYPPQAPMAMMHSGQQDRTPDRFNRRGRN
ncbi:hypothetical protein CkaCkLH20_12105 [Colletotrichum karsti]|uniref:Uncharacterized protein n=1 Tax=Colletotrichum karsti TaxID=1095194 RepID=A0A9P6HTP2_9PEZI|nr:uncharacterized protein CkaCkLH20_12105 [Colletotrichum karsti]KAF9870438.1 hypothetical protein CkaCkLH20_12105 [Colletotrichum karsti]